MTIYEGVALLRQGKKIRRKTWKDPQAHLDLIKDKDGFSMFDKIALKNKNKADYAYTFSLSDFDGDIWELYQ